MERAAYMTLHHQVKAPFKGNRPAAGSAQSKPPMVVPTTGTTARHTVLPYDEASPSGEPETWNTVPPPSGTTGTLYDESTMYIDQIMEDMYRDC
ncbi:hypothetical protein M422DRAFT_277325 [Sphaerobolus stellatus SS14]|uniref:Uncharacterized protein n=1 Tax=Sphaerobolus stellatus (strain SS14) TaxID=990650 RepID=A0A0C9UAZ0_SPHS4|nr:hypothetical protein M422DRAFT_277325 [Sphaerobolus stellatus SS14]